MERVTLGRIVLFVLPNGEKRPAFVVAVRPGTDVINLQVVPDGANDLPYNTPPAGYPAAFLPKVWEQGVEYSEEPKPGTWHWPERV